MRNWTVLGHVHTPCTSLVRLSSTLCPVFITLLDEKKCFVQGYDPYETVDENGILRGHYFQDYEQNYFPIDYFDATSPDSSESTSNSDEFLEFAGDEWLTKVRQVHFSLLV
jgi:hypothetical protein